MEHLEDFEMRMRKAEEVDEKNKIRIGSDVDYYSFGTGFDCVIHAAKEPWHRAAVGYTGRSAPPMHPDYYYATEVNNRQTVISLNLVDAREVKYIPWTIFATVLEFLKDNSDAITLVHCNRGESRAPGLVFAYYIATGQVDTTSFKTAVKDFKNNFYPGFKPNQGISDFLKMHFNSLKGYFKND